MNGESFPVNQICQSFIEFFDYGNIYMYVKDNLAHQYENVTTIIYEKNV